ncbi:hypothetical protein X275_01375 [Marinitoga sp. 1197]|uniref:Uncharacterized protein n=1 Tax=Marinitoga hydrogenitolerans (strain DSM 16785 / JCM 12826 / AT1271) TaxID=1122195 RepID=A0A1M4TV39_MARH1|nr:MULTISPECIES: hypothetical protein [Marinitoga]AJW76922.1 hypothetical protein UF08_33 [Marinitoga camini virus 1]KLO24066.1 hypothetical protein X275_01375 [Marinitoga sp. 1197]SHE48285.1 hypothetical protein SAMN02745164_00518 [Marinitoga hydrogenitolerans DSM 16785]
MKNYYINNNEYEYVFYSKFELNTLISAIITQYNQAAYSLEMYWLVKEKINEREYSYLRQYSIPFYYAENYFVKLDMCVKITDEIRKYTNKKSNIKNFLKRINKIFPNLKYVRNSIAHYEARIQNKGPYDKKAINDDTNVIIGNIIDDKYQTEIYVEKNIKFKANHKKKKVYEKKRITIELTPIKLGEFKEQLLKLLKNLE